MLECVQSLSYNLHNLNNSKLRYRNLSHYILNVKPIPVAWQNDVNMDLTSYLSYRLVT